MADATTLNVNAAECIRTSMHFGFTKMHNICSGVITDVPWGGVDWLILIGFGGFGLAVIVMMAALGIAIVRDAW